MLVRSVSNVASGSTSAGTGLSNREWGTGMYRNTGSSARLRMRAQKTEPGSSPSSMGNPDPIPQGIADRRCSKRRVVDGLPEHGPELLAGDEVSCRSEEQADVTISEFLDPLVLRVEHDVVTAVDAGENGALSDGLDRLDEFAMERGLQAEERVEVLVGEEAVQVDVVVLGPDAVHAPVALDRDASGSTAGRS